VSAWLSWRRPGGSAWFSGTALPGSWRSADNPPSRPGRNRDNTARANGLTLRRRSTPCCGRQIRWRCWVCSSVWKISRRLFKDPLRPLLGRQHIYEVGFSACQREGACLPRFWRRTAGDRSRNDLAERIWAISSWPPAANGCRQIRRRKRSNSRMWGAELERSRQPSATPNLKTPAAAPRRSRFLTVCGGPRFRVMRVQNPHWHSNCTRLDAAFVRSPDSPWGFTPKRTCLVVP
jgi:hypothetical protein